MEGNELGRLSTEIGRLSSEINNLSGAIGEIKGGLAHMATEAKVSELEGRLGELKPSLATKAELEKSKNTLYANAGMVFLSGLLLAARYVPWDKIG